MLIATTSSTGSQPWAGGSMVSGGDDREGYTAPGKGSYPVYGNRKHCEKQTREGYNYYLYSPL
jgi:hypothetical protein